MISVIDEILKLRKGKPIVIDYENTNRYRIVLIEDDGTKTDYYFTTPIYNDETRRVVDLMFHKDGNGIHSTGSNTKISYSECIRMKNAEGVCNILVNKPVEYIDEHTLRYENNYIIPTINGFLYKVYCKDRKQFTFELQTSKPFMEIRGNNKYFSLMSERFRPFVTVSCNGTADGTGEIIAPSKVNYQKISDHNYRITVFPCSPFGEWLLFEVNLYENKLVQDTTVESKNPKTNNAYGSSAFIGNTAEFGEMWLYSRPDPSKMIEILEKKILKATAHLPKFNCSDIELSAFKVSARFCSFGSTWSNKIPPANALSDSVTCGRYQSFDVTEIFTDTSGYMPNSDGFIIRPKHKDSGFSAVATADSYFAPQIFEINYK